MQAGFHIFIYIYQYLVHGLGTTPVEEHRPAEEVVDPAHEDMASAMKQDEYSLASVDQVAGLHAQISGQPHHRLCLHGSRS